MTKDKKGNIRNKKKGKEYRREGMREESYKYVEDGGRDGSKEGGEELQGKGRVRVKGRWDDHRRKEEEEKEIYR